MKVVVLAGGTSTERDVSLVSGSQIYKALLRNGHKAVLADVYLGIDECDEDIFEKDKDWAEGISGVTEINPDLDAVKALRKDGGKSFFGPNILKLCAMADVVFLALHGANGEDGKLQATLELMGIPYTGTDYVSSAMAMNKSITKDIFAAHNIPMAKGVRLVKGEKDERKVPLPCIIKACTGGSSVGVAVSMDESQYEAAKAEAFKYDDEVVIEQFIKGREFSIGVIDGKALPVIEIAPKVGMYDYKNKYQAGSTVETCPAHITDAQRIKLQSAAEAAFWALRLSSYARIDFLMDENDEVYCLEANTLPGMTPTSLLPQEAQAAGISFDELCEKILGMAVGK
ncbi:MAG: D-alanine--D-alanine ligase [Lachnospiraceae bacterium]|nr:D-alanine--D-alanine ligase [Lachnospiraceae bacterium]